MASRKRDFTRLLECIAVSDALDSMLLLGARAGILELVRERLSQLLRAAGAKAVDTVRLGSADTEDSLWGIPGLPVGWGGHGLLVPPAQTTRIVIIPDLSRLSQAAARAGVMMMGAREVEIERRGQSQRMPLRHRWLAALEDDDVGSVSPHLLERFAIRVRFDERMAQYRVSELKRELGNRRAAASRVDVGRVRKRSKRAPTVEDGAIKVALEIAGATSATASMRVPLALLHVACAWARLDGARVVDERTTRHAAAALGLANTQDAAAAPSDVQPQAHSASPLANAAVPQEPSGVAAGPAQIVTAINDESEGAPVDDARDLAADDVIDAALPPIVAVLPTRVDAKTAADSPPRQSREYTTLRLPWRQSRVASSGRGAIVGTRRTDVVQDLAVMESLLAAAPFQRQRRKRLERTSDEIILRRQDLRAYRRAPPASELLVLVLDYTSVKNPAWLRTLVPFLAEAYAARAELCIIKVGGRYAENRLRAERVLARSILVPSVAAALDEAPGQATPLADGLFQAYRVIQQALGHGRTSTRRATLVVVSDGRGNVTLEASRHGRSTGRVGRQGIEDAQRVARELRAMSNVKRVLIDPEPQWMRELPFALAASLGAGVVRLDKSDA